MWNIQIAIASRGGFEKTLKNKTCEPEKQDWKWKRNTALRSWMNLEKKITFSGHNLTKIQFCMNSEFRQRNRETVAWMSVVHFVWAPEQGHYFSDLSKYSC